MNPQTSIRGAYWPLILIFIGILLFFIKDNLNAQPAGFTDQLFIGGWNEVAGFTWDANGRMYVWERDGRVWIVENGSRLPDPLLDISDEVGGWRDFGLLGFALDPNFTTNGFYYLLYVVDRHHLLNFGTPDYDPGTNEYFDATIGRITRYQADPSSNFTSTISSSRAILVGTGPGDGPPILHESHGTGSLVFGEDGTLLATMGDGASYNSTDQGSASETYYSQGIADGIITSAQNIGAYRCQTLDNYNGKILRIDPQTGHGLPSNPYWNPSQPSSVASRTWSVGVRNPYRMSIKPGSGSHDASDGNPGVMLFGDVGWGNREELNVVDGPGLNFGWPKFEGMTHMPGYNNSSYEPATHERPKVDWRNGSPRGLVNGNIVNVGSGALPGPNFNGNASTGGFWYAGDDFPEEWQDSYFHADYGEGWIRNFKFDENWNPIEVKNFIGSAGACVFLNSHPSTGSLYYVRWPNQIRQVTFTGTTQHDPVVFASANIYNGPSPLTVSFSSENTYDEDGDPLTFLWNFGDGNTSTSPNPVHTFGNSSVTVPFGYNVSLTVTDNTGRSASTNLNISINNSPPNILSTSVDGVNTFNPEVTTNLSLSANVNDPNHPTGDLDYFWEGLLYHNNHNHPLATFTSQTATLPLTPIECYAASYWYKVRLTVTDPNGASDYYEKDIFPACTGSGQSISFSSISDKTVVDGPFNISASASSGLPVSFYIVDGPASVLGNTVTLDGVPGFVTIAATQPGNGTYAPAFNVERSFWVNVGSGGNCAGTGLISREVWTGVSGVAVSDIPLSTTPDVEDQLTIFEIPVNTLDNFGTRVRGYICPPITGNYRFWISSDDNGELWLSTDGNPSNKQLIANVPGWSSSRQWDKFPEQQSSLIPLAAGQVYYIEALQKEQGGGDNLAVGWQLPNGTQERPIPGNRLLPFGGAPPTALFSATPTSGDAPLLVDFNAGASNDPDGNIVTYGWDFGDGNTANGISPSHTYINPNVYTAELTVVDNDGNVSTTSQTITVTAGAPQDQSISFSPIPDKLTTDVPFNLSATASSGLPVSFSIVSGPASISGNSVILDGTPGTVTVRATQTGNANWNPAPPIDRSFDVTAPTGGGDIDLSLSVVSSSPTFTIYNSIGFTFTLQNDGPDDATDVWVFLPKPSTVVWVGGNEFEVSQGIYDYQGAKIWYVGNLASGASAEVTVNWFTLSEDPITAWAEVSQAGQDDSDSTPSNGACCTANEDDEAAVTVTIPGAGPQPQNINFSTISNKETDDPPFSISATATSGLPVSLSIVSGPATIVGDIISLTGNTGTVTVRATQSGDASWLAATPVEQTFQVNEPGLDDQTILFGNLPNRQVDEPPFNLAATASSGLPVSFEILGGPAILSGNTVTLTGGTGTVTVRATQGGDSQYNPAIPVDRSFAVTPVGGNVIDLELEMSSNSPTITQWGSIEFTATLTNVGNTAASGVKVSFPKPSSVVFTGGNEFDASTGTFGLFSDQIWNVGNMPAGATETITVSWFVLQNQPLTAWAEVSAMNGSDVDSSPGNGSSPAVNEDDEAAFTATVPGSGPADQTISFAVIPDKETDDGPFNISASATSGLPVSFSIVSGPASISGNTITLNGSTGQVTVRATQGGNSNWNPAPAVERTFNVNVPGLDDQSITFPTISNKETDDTPFNISATASSGLPVSFSILSGPATVSGNTITLTGATGQVVVQASQAGNGQYNPAPSVNRSFTVVEPGGSVGPDLKVEMTSSGTELTIWQNVTFNITVTNEGTETANGIVLDLPIPQGMAHTSNNPDVGTYNLFTTEWELGTLAAGESANFEFLLFILQNTTPIPYFVEVLESSPNDVDSTPGNGDGNPVEDDEALITLLPPNNPLMIDDSEMFGLFANSDGAVANLRWESSLGEYCLRYIVERSKDGFIWEDFSHQENQIFENVKASYYATDERPNSGWNFYRVKLMRQDASFLFSNVVMLEFWEDLYEYKLFPNPAGEYVDINLSAVAGLPVRILLVDRMGRLVKERMLQEAPLDPYRFELDGMRDGWYVVWLQPAGKRAKALPLMIGR